jgi:hypothetical protein
LLILQYLIFAGQEIKNDPTYLCYLLDLYPNQFKFNSQYFSKELYQQIIDSQLDVEVALRKLALQKTLETTLSITEKHSNKFKL